MNIKVKKIVAVALTVSAFSAIAPMTNLNLLTTKAYAATGDLTKIELKKSSGGSIQVYDDDDYKSKNKVDDDDLKDGDTYYAKSSSKKVKISTSGVSSNLVRIFKGTSSSTKGEKPGESIELTSGSTKTLTIRTYSEDPKDVKYGDKDKVKSEYKIEVKYKSSSSDDDDDKDDDVYLKSISLSNGDLSFSKKTSSYNVNVPESVSDIKITAKPDCDKDDYDDYKVEIDGSEVDEDDNFRKTVSLDKGENKIKITVEDDDDNERTYTLNITRAKASTTTNTNNTNTNTNTNTGTTTTSKVGWAQVNGRWQYNDSWGRPLKAQWFFDRNYGKWYYLGADGNMQTGWILDGGKYYYLYSDGSMAANTTIGGYRVGSDGAWIN